LNSASFMVLYNIVSTLICFPSNFFIGLDIFGYVLVLVLAFMLTIYYFSRIRKQSKFY
jgi:hypothetical protein